MSTWRRVAIERFPERRIRILATSSIDELLGGLAEDVQAVYGGVRDEAMLPERAFVYAAWCHGSHQNPTLRKAAAVSFYKRLATCPLGRAELAQRLTLTEMQELEPLFFRGLPLELYAALEVEILRAHGSRWQSSGRPER